MMTELDRYTMLAARRELLNSSKARGDGEAMYRDVSPGFLQGTLYFTLHDVAEGTQILTDQNRKSLLNVLETYFMVKDAEVKMAEIKGFRAQVKDILENFKPAEREKLLKSLEMQAYHTGMYRYNMFSMVEIDPKYRTPPSPGLFGSAKRIDKHLLDVYDEIETQAALRLVVEDLKDCNASQRDNTTRDSVISKLGNQPSNNSSAGAINPNAKMKVKL